jgi:hypothetical protein
MTPGMEAALLGRQVLMAGLLQIDYPDYTLRLCDGSAAINFNGDIFTGSDERFGTIAAVEAISEAAGDSAPGLVITLFPPDLTSAVELSSPQMQGSSVKLWLCVVDPVTGLVVPEPELLFVGEVDVPTLKGSGTERSVEVQCVSVFEELFADNEGARLSDSFHKEVWPGETGLENMTGIVRNILWGPGERTSGITERVSPGPRIDIR